jgi:protein-S-isoprenylcysteine O-methyltransferase Ste14
LKEKAMIFIYISVYLIIISFYVIERLLRKNNAAKTLEKTKYDKGSTYFIGYSLSLSNLILLIVPILNNYGIGRIKSNIMFNIFGLFVMLVGISIRIISAKTLGMFYTRTLRKSENQRIIKEGIYKFIRHPGYLGDLLIFLGSCIAVSNIISTILITVLMLSSYIYRIMVEEKMLIDVFGESYKNYTKETKRLIPFIF